MSTRKLAPTLIDMLDAIHGIEAATSGKSFADYSADWLLRRGVERGIEIISEASRRLPDSVTDTHPEIPWKQIRGVGNLLRHEYHTIADKIIWAVVTDHIGPLKAAVVDLRKVHSGQPKN